MNHHRCSLNKVNLYIAYKLNNLKICILDSWDESKKKKKRKRKNKPCIIVARQICFPLTLTSRTPCWSRIGDPSWASLLPLSSSSLSPHHQSVLFAVSTVSRHLCYCLSLSLTDPLSSFSFPMFSSASWTPPAMTSPQSHSPPPSPPLLRRTL